MPLGIEYPLFGSDLKSFCHPSAAAKGKIPAVLLCPRIFPRGPGTLDSHSSTVSFLKPTYLDNVRSSFNIVVVNTQAETKCAELLRRPY